MPPADAALESIWCRAAIAGDREAWQCLYGSAAESLQRYARWRSGGRDDMADDALQDAWLTIAKSLGRFDSARGSFIDWARAIVANAVRNQLRSRRRHEERASPFAGTETMPTQRDGLAVAEALSLLSDEYEMVLRLKYLDGRSVTEIAAIDGESDKAIESRLTRAREAFRKAYGDER